MPNKKAWIASGITHAGREQVAEKLRRCNVLREFAEAVRAVAVEEVGAADAGPKVTRWLAWAERVAGRKHPLGRLRRSEAGRRRPR